MLENYEVDLSQWFSYEIPGFVPVRQKFFTEKLKDVAYETRQQMHKAEIAGKLKEGMKIAVAVGSRGITNLQQIVTTVISCLREQGCEPFIIPAMGSHGGATAEGQRAILQSYGITEENVGAPVISSMETVCLGESRFHNRLFIDRQAYGADGIIVINRIKVHTDFKGSIESGLTKMLVIGLGKNDGAKAAHALGVVHFHEALPESARCVMEKAKILFGLAIVENAYDQTMLIEAIEAKRIIEREAELLQIAKKHMGRILPESFDVLLVEEMGKEISGTGMDTNITGRSLTEVEGFQGPNYQRLAVMGLSEHSDGNATGVGAADVITKALLERINFNYLYTNALTSSIVKSPKIPMVMPTEKLALIAAISTCTGINKERPRIVFIRNTLQLEYILVSEGMKEELSQREDLEFLAWDKQFPLFDDQGRFRIRPSICFS